MCSLLAYMGEAAPGRPRRRGGTPDARAADACGDAATAPGCAAAKVVDAMAWCRAWERAPDGASVGGAKTYFVGEADGGANFAESVAG